jgi:hypothetical protein
MPQFILGPGVGRERALKLAHTVLSSLDGLVAWRVTAEPVKRQRSLSQNAYLWAVYELILKLGGEEMGGWTKEDLHEFFLIHHFGHNVRKLFGKKRLVPLRRSSKLTTIEFREFVDAIHLFMAERGVFVPDPDPSYWSKP